MNITMKYTYIFLRYYKRIMLDNITCLTGDPLHSRALAHSRAPWFTQPCSHCSHSRAPGEQWARLCVFTLQGCVQAARMCRGSPVMSGLSTPDGLLEGYGDVIKRKHFPPYWSFVRGIHRSPVNSPTEAIDVKRGPRNFHWLPHTILNYFIINHAAYFKMYNNIFALNEDGI